jgi:hypothetical protein
MTTGGKEYINKFQEILSQCEERTLDDNLYSFTQGLPERVREFVSSNKDNFNDLKNMFCAVLRYEAMHPENRTVALQTNIQGIPCQFCNKKGHTESFCWKKKKPFNSNRPPEKIIKFGPHDK